MNICRLFAGLGLALLSSNNWAEPVQLSVNGVTTNLEAPVGALRLTVSGPDGTIWTQTSSAKDRQFNLGNLKQMGSYQYRIEADGVPLVRSNPGGGALNPEGRIEGSAATPKIDLPILAGSFRVTGEGVIHPLTASSNSTSRTDGSTQAKDQVIPDDLIVQGSGCFGFDCVNNESFGFDTIRMKENNLRIKFEDTSVGEFATNDWQLTANDSASGGANKFSIEDITGAKVPLTITGGAATNSLFIDSTGRVGFRTSTPVLDLHVNTSNTPATRLEQNSSGGFTAQTWDIAGNEANFFVRDVTSNSRLPFRIRPGAPTSSIDISADGDVGMGTASPSARVHMVANLASGPILKLTNSNAAFSSAPDRFEVDAAGNVTARGLITQQSSRNSKTDLRAVEPKRVLDALATLELLKWRYKEAASNDTHLGPTAEDFHQAFGLGLSDKVISPMDLAAVALAAAQGLQAELRARDDVIADLRERLEKLEQQQHEAQ